MDNSKKIIGTTYSDEGIRNLGSKKMSTERVIEHYWPFLKERIVELYKRLYDPREGVLDKLKYKVKRIGEEGFGTKFSFRFDVVFEHPYGDDWLMGFKLSESGNCCGSMFLYSIELDRVGMQCKGLGKILLAMAEDIAIAQKAFNLLCINVEDRNFNTHLLNRGFKGLDKFFNENSGNYCILFSKSLGNKFEKRDIEVIS